MAVLGILAALGIFLGAANAATLGVVSTEGGMVEGKNNGVGLFRYMDVFKGVPFAAPPGRFQKPVPHPGWTGVLKATEFSKRCLQLTLLQSGTRGSEDCLYLNIWVPQGRSVSTGLPVMLFFYGGAFLMGGSQGANFLDNYLYSGEEIADRGNVIVVTVNYRLGTLGFLSSGDSELPGNYGLWDQHAAIGWVFRNIKAFGGDPSNITIFGESAGGASVSFQMLSPHNKGMIRRAISQSGVALCPWAVNRNPRAYAEEVAKNVGCPTDQSMFSCLKMTDPSQLTLAGPVSLGSSPSNPVVNNLSLSPVIDGDFLPDEPSNLFGNAADIDYIAGINDMDGHMFSGVDVPSVNQPLQNTPVEDVKELLTALTRVKGPEAAASAFSQYSSGWSSKPTNVEVKKTIVDIETDYIFLVPTQTALYLHNKHANTARTYSYLFSEPSRMPIYPSWMGADHADDLQYVFGKPFATPLGYWPRHRKVSKYMIAYWTNFAKTGDPNSGPSEVPVTWPRLTGQDHQFVDINNSMGKTSVKQKLRSRFVHFWTNTFISFPNVN
ncbi:carboxyl ester lipase, tandem duplicate 2 [Astyanax mexicanus]|uniref:carboxyl ester lipase, tandem duplicate 2 n=1 Tax=Astyanax mexicanus TaxID=7994 RepID=UPI0020CB576C|nr:carboxyl ester lipase, tandem duplicate 2 [Astyanax mexicanus]